jgi:hypothetical protein
MSDLGGGIEINPAWIVFLDQALRRNRACRASDWQAGLRSGHFRPRALASHSLSRSSRGRVGWGRGIGGVGYVWPRYPIDGFSSGAPHPNPPPRRAGEGAQHRKHRCDQNFGKRASGHAYCAGCGSGQMISTRPPGPEWIASRKPCSLTIAATRLRPRPTPGVVLILSER